MHLALRFILTALILLSIGCVGGEPPTEPSAEQLNAQDSIKYATAEYSNFQDAYEKFRNELDLAKSRRVDTFNIRSFDEQINSILLSANKNIKLANQYYSAGQYSPAYNTAQNTISSLEEIDPLLNQANNLLKSAYENTIAHYKKKIQESEREIKITSAYIQDAKNSGADVQNLDSDLSVTSNLLGNVKSSFSNMEFLKIDRYLADISSNTKKIQEDAIYTKRYHLTSTAIVELKKIIKSDEGNKIINDAIAEKNRGNFEKAIDLLNKALISDVFIEYKSNKLDLIKYCQNNNLQLGIDQIDSLESDIESKIISEKYSEVTKLTPDYREKVELALGASIKVSNAKLALEALRGTTYLWIKTDPTKATELYTKATGKLKYGKYSEAIADASLSIEESQKEKENFYSKIETSTIKNALSLILSIFGKGPPSMVFKTVEGISFSWPILPEILVNIDLSPPNVDIETGKLETISSPLTSPPNLGTSHGQRPVDFSLYISEPTHSVGLFGVDVTGTASIKNTGGQTGHNVRIKFEMFSSDGKRIKLSGRDYFERSVGDLRGGETKTETVEFLIGLGDGRTIQSKGAKGVYYIYSDEKSKIIEESFVV